MAHRQCLAPFREKVCPPLIYSPPTRSPDGAPAASQAPPSCSHTCPQERPCFPVTWFCFCPQCLSFFHTQMLCLPSSLPQRSPHVRSLPECHPLQNPLPWVSSLDRRRMAPSSLFSASCSWNALAFLGHPSFLTSIFEVSFKGFLSEQRAARSTHLSCILLFCFPGGVFSSFPCFLLSDHSFLSLLRFSFCLTLKC